MSAQSILAALSAPTAFAAGATGASASPITGARPLPGGDEEAAPEAFDSLLAAEMAPEATGTAVPGPKAAPGPAEPDPAPADDDARTDAPPPPPLPAPEPVEPAPSRPSAPEAAAEAFTRSEAAPNVAAPPAPPSGAAPAPASALLGDPAAPASAPAAMPAAAFEGAVVGDGQIAAPEASSARPDRTDPPAAPGVSPAPPAAPAPLRPALAALTPTTARATETDPASAAPEAGDPAGAGADGRPPQSPSLSPALSPAQPAGAPAEAGPLQVQAQGQTQPQGQAQGQTPAPGDGAPAVDRSPPALPSGAPGAPSQLSRAAVDATAQVAAQILRRLDGRASRFEMVLTPESLGRVDVSLDIDSDGRLAARLAFDNPAAAADLRGRADELRRQLEAAGFQLTDDAFEFAERDAAAGQGFDRGRDRALSFARGRRLDAAADAPAPVASPWMSLSLTPRGVDLKV